MAGKTKIEWTETTWNPVRGCVKISPGCKHCYAETFAERWRGIPGHPYEQGFDVRLAPEVLGQPIRWVKPREIFVNSMSDLFQDGIPIEYLRAVFGVMAMASNHVFQVLTKRAKLMADFALTTESIECLAAFARSGANLGPNPLHRQQELQRRGIRGHADLSAWPLANVWLGVSVEDRRFGLPRIAELQRTPAALRFLSIEPLLEDVGELDLRGIGWVIVGGESGPGAREMDGRWVRSIRDQCREAEVPFFFKQWGGVLKKIRGRELDGRTWDEKPEGLTPFRLAS